MEAHVLNNFFLRWDFTFQVTRAIKLPISAGDWHFSEARFSKNQVYIYMDLKVYILPPMDLIFSQAMLNIVYQMLIVTNVRVNSAAL